MPNDSINIAIFRDRYVSAVPAASNADRQSQKENRRPKMRKIGPQFAIGLAATLTLLLFHLPQEATANPFGAVITAVIGLADFITGIVSNMQSRNLEEIVTIKVWMHIGDPAMNGCGLYFRAEGYGGRSTNGWFPRKWGHQCGQEKYSMRMTSQSASYQMDSHLGNDQAKKLEVHADGWHDTYVNTLCIGLSSRTIVAGPRALCIDNDLLKACKAATNRWNNLNLEYNDIKFTRTSRGIHKLVINNVPEVVTAYEQFGKYVQDTEAARTICGNIKLIRGKDSSNSHTCTANRKRQGVPPFGVAYYDEREIHKNPYGCRRYEGN